MCNGNENLPVADDEFILRRIHKNNYKPGLTPPVLRPAFEPNSSDDDGLSLYRECITSVQTLAITGNQPGSYYIARLSVSMLRGSAYSLTIDAAPDPDPAQPRGHCVIRQLSIQLHKQDPQSAKGLEKRLAALASQDIVYVPSGCLR